MRKKLAALLLCIFLLPFSVLASERTWWDEYVDAVDYVTNYGMMMRDRQGSFRALDGVTRAEFIQALWVFEGEPAFYEITEFYDVSPFDRYFRAIQWAAENYISVGIGEGYFAPNAYLTRSQMNTILNRYLRYIDAMSATDFYVFPPGRMALRAEAAITLYFFMQNLPAAEMVTYFNSLTYGTRFAMPTGLTVDPDGNVVVFDTFNAAVTRIRDGQTEAVIHGANVLDEFGFAMPFHVDGPVETALLGRPVAGVYSPNGDFFIVDRTNHAIRRLSGNTVDTFAEGFYYPTAIAINRNRQLLVANTQDHTIKRVTVGGAVQHVAGVSGEYGHRDGAVAQALFNEPSGIAVAPNGDIFVADTGNHVIRRISGGMVTTISGVLNPIEYDEYYSPGGFVNGPAHQAQFNFPRGLYYTDGVLFIADTGNHAIRMLMENNVYTIAGSGEPGNTDGRFANATMNQPTDVFYADGVLFIMDSLNHSVRKLPLPN